MTNLEWFKNNVENLNLDERDSLCIIAYASKHEHCCGNDNIRCDECELNENIKSIVNVLLEEHKKIELTRFEFDMLKISENEHPQLKYLNENLYYTRLKEKGYFKNVDLNMTAEEVLDNCEIVD